METYVSKHDLPYPDIASLCPLLGPDWSLNLKRGCPMGVRRVEVQALDNLLCFLAEPVEFVLANY